MTTRQRAAGLSQTAPLTPDAILYHDQQLVAVHKPGGLIVHRRPGNTRDPAALQAVRDLLGQHVYPVHRLDRATSGVLLFALSRDIARQIGAQFAAHTVTKGYWAVVRGYTERRGLIDYPLAADAGKPAREAVTEFRTSRTVELPIPVGPYAAARYSLVQAHPKTGRRHQIRRHFKHISHPLIGDTTYGDSAHNRMFRKQFGLHRLLLIAAALSFEHPVTKRRVEIRTSPDSELSELFHTFGWTLP